MRHCTFVWALAMLGVANAATGAAAPALMKLRRFMENPRWFRSVLATVSAPLSANVGSRSLWVKLPLGKGLSIGRSCVNFYSQRKFVMI
ncbi:hypothetical protein [Salinihabitans flavidus]|uniref:hypothetical protein n=1 Tax=Salinihabitans flavidus TaxID=569882 RepID=UPI0015875C69|nr:hypothetical protein [Salinihabitans flavidus]